MTSPSNETQRRMPAADELFSNIRQLLNNCGTRKPCRDCREPIWILRTSAADARQMVYDGFGARHLNCRDGRRS